MNLHTYTGWGGVSHWNAFVANLEMHGKGTFFDPRLDDPLRFPVAARAGFGNVRNDPDLITAKLPALQFYQLSIPAPDAAARQLRSHRRPRRAGASSTARRSCATCHVPPLFTEPGWNMHTAAEIGIDDFQSSRSPDERYRTTPLGRAVHAAEGRLLSRRPVRRPARRGRSLRPDFQPESHERQKRDLIEYLKSL